MKLNESSILEGIFAIIVGVVLSEGKVSRSEVNYIRSIIEPSLFSTGRARKEISRESVRNRDNGKMDKFKVVLDITLYDSEGIGYRAAREIGKLNDKINSLILQASPFNNDMIDNLLEQRNSFLNDNTDQEIIFNVIVDGNSDQSVNVELSVSDKTLTEVQIPFHTRIDTKTNNKDYEPFERIRDLGHALKVKKIEDILYSFFPVAITPMEKMTKANFVKSALQKLFYHIQQDKVQTTKKSFDFLRECIFDEEYNYFIDTDDIDTKTLNTDVFAELERTTKINIVSRGKNELLFKDIKSGIVLFVLTGEIKTSPYIQVNFSLSPGNYGTKIKNIRQS